MNQKFSPHPPTTFYIDINSCFTTIEQQATSHLRGKPVVVAAYATNGGCILAASYEAKRLGITTGMRVGDGKRLYPQLTVLLPDPEKYRYVNNKLTTLLFRYSPCVQVQSIDEMIVRMANTPLLLTQQRKGASVEDGMKYIALLIKKDIAREIGEWITVSIGIAPNAFLAKTASNLQKPNGLKIITKDNIEAVLSNLTLTDLCGIKHGNATRLRSHGIQTPLAMYKANQQALTRAFHSCIGWYWWMWLHGWEAGSIYEEKPNDPKKSFSQSCALKYQTSPHDRATVQVIYQLVSKMAMRLRTDGYEARFLYVGFAFTDKTYWQKHVCTSTPQFATDEIFKRIYTLTSLAPVKPIHTVFVGLGKLQPTLYSQLSLDETIIKTTTRTKALDAIYKRFGDQVVTSGITLCTKQHVMDRIAFGKSSL